jgi:hypothetical protein
MIKEAVVPNEQEFRRFKQRRRSFTTAELSEERAEAIGASRMDERHAHLDSMLKQTDEARASKL